MNDKILVVDDEQNLLDSLKRQLRKKFSIITALGPEKGLESFSGQGPFPVVVSDLSMPGMNGIEFLSRVKKCTPESVCILLTGNADLENAIKAVNEGAIFRFLTKPCHPEVLSRALEQGIEQHRLLTAEKELLEKTLKGSIKVLTEVLSLVNPEAFGRSARIKRYAARIARILGVANVWEVETAAMLSQIGCVVLPKETMNKVYLGKELDDEEARLFDKHPAIASDLLSHIPRMQHVAEIISDQNNRFFEGRNSDNQRRIRDISLGARILKVVLDYDILESKGFEKTKALKELKTRSRWYDPKVLGVLEQVLGVKAEYVAKNVSISGLKDRMILSEDVCTLKGQLLISRGQKVSPVLIKRLKNFARNAGVREPIRVFVLDSQA